MRERKLVHEIHGFYNIMLILGQTKITSFFYYRLQCMRLIITLWGTEYMKRTKFNRDDSGETIGYLSHN